MAKEASVTSRSSPNSSQLFAPNAFRPTIRQINPTASTAKRNQSNAYFCVGVYCLICA